TSGRPVAGEYSRTDSGNGCPHPPRKEKGVESATSGSTSHTLSTAVETRVEAKKIPANRVDRPLWTGREILIETASTRCYARHPLGSSARSFQGVERHIELTAEDLWDEVSTKLREALNDTTYSTWFGEVDGAHLDADSFVIAVPNDFTREWIEGHF